MKKGYFLSGVCILLVLITQGCGKPAPKNMPQNSGTPGTSKLIPFIAVKIAGGFHSFAVKDDGNLWAAGLNDKGQLGTGDYHNRDIFVPVFSGISRVAAGGWHSLAIKTDGTLWATERNIYGELGTGDFKNIDNWTQIFKRQ